MRGYGLPRYFCVEHPDVADIKEFGLNSSTGRIPKKNGDIPSYFHNSASKRSTRSIYKRRARAQAKNDLRKYYN